MEDKFCQGCGKKLNTTLFIGEKTYTFKEGLYCEVCAKIKVEKKRSKI